MTTLERLIRSDVDITEVVAEAERVAEGHPTPEPAPYGIRFPERYDSDELIRRLDRTEDERTATRRLVVAALVGPLLVFLFQVWVAAHLGGTP